eukprot:1833500-Pleurochrysis_carterae.AAC.1
MCLFWSEPPFIFPNAPLLNLDLHALSSVPSCLYFVAFARALVLAGPAPCGHARRQVDRGGGAQRSLPRFGRRPALAAAKQQEERGQPQAQG